MTPSTHATEAAILAQMIIRAMEMAPRYGDQIVYVRKDGAIHFQALKVLALAKRTNNPKNTPKQEHNHVN